MCVAAAVREMQDYVDDVLAREPLIVCFFGSGKRSVSNLHMPPGVAASGNCTCRRV